MFFYLIAEAGFYIRYAKKSKVQEETHHSPQQHLSIEKMLGILNTYDSYSFSYSSENIKMSPYFLKLKQKFCDRYNELMPSYIPRIKKEKDSIRFKTELFYNLSANIEYKVPSKDKKFQHTEKPKNLNEKFFTDHKIFLGLEYYYTRKPT